MTVEEQLLSIEGALTVQDVARILKVADETVITWHKKRDLPAHKVGKLWRFEAIDVVKWWRKRRVT